MSLMFISEYNQTYHTYLLLLLSWTYSVLRIMIQVITRKHDINIQYLYKKALTNSFKCDKFFENLPLQKLVICEWTLIVQTIPKIKHTQFMTGKND